MDARHFVEWDKAYLDDFASQAHALVCSRRCVASQASNGPHQQGLQIKQGKRTQKTQTQQYSIQRNTPFLQATCQVCVSSRSAAGTQDIHQYGWLQQHASVNRPPGTSVIDLRSFRSLYSMLRLLRPPHRPLANTSTDSPG